MMEQWRDSDILDTEIFSLPNENISSGNGRIFSRGNQRMKYFTSCDDDIERKIKDSFRKKNQSRLGQDFSILKLLKSLYK